MRYKQFEAWVESGGRRLEEFDHELDMDPYDNGNCELMSCWIESEIGKTFEINVMDHSKPLTRSSQVVFEPDGIYADEMYIRGSKDVGIGGSVDKCSWVVSKGAPVSENTYKRYVFSSATALKGASTFDPGLGSDSDEELEPDVGTISIEIRECIVTGDRTDDEPWCPPYFVEFAESPLDEDTKKMFCHRVGLSKKIHKMLSPPDQIDIELVGYEHTSSIEFCFKYRPKEYLEANHLLSLEESSSTPPEPMIVETEHALTPAPMPAPAPTPTNLDLSAPTVITDPSLPEVGPGTPGFSRNLGQNFNIPPAPRPARAPMQMNVFNGAVLPPEARPVGGPPDMHGHMQSSTDTERTSVPIVHMQAAVPVPDERQETCTISTSILVESEYIPEASTSNTIPAEPVPAPAPLTMTVDHVSGDHSNPNSMNPSSSSLQKRSRTPVKEEDEENTDVLGFGQRVQSDEELRARLEYLQSQYAEIQRRQADVTKMVKNTAEMLQKLKFWQEQGTMNQRSQREVMKELRNSEACRRKATRSEPASQRQAGPSRKRIKTESGIRQIEKEIVDLTLD